MIEAKAIYEPLVNFYKKYGAAKFVSDWLKQSERQLQAAGPDRKVVWVFAERDTAEFAKKLFKAANKGRARIIITVIPWSPGKK